MNHFKLSLLTMVFVATRFAATAQWSTNQNGDAYISKNVGIWTSSPQARFHIIDPFFGNSLLIQNTNDPNAWKYQMTLSTSNNFFRVGKVAPQFFPVMGNGSVGLGDEVVASGNTSFAAGRQSTAAGESSVALTFGTANGLGSFAWGLSAISDADYSSAMGKLAHASGYSSFAIGENTKATAQNSMAIGYGAQATNTAAVAMGASSASGIYSSAFGQSTARGAYSTATGKSTSGGGEKSGDYTFAAGNSTANASYSTALSGGVTGLNAIYATAVNKANADGAYSFASGSSYTLGQYATALGYSQADADYSFSSGYLSGAYGVNSSAIGTYVSAIGKNSMVLGQGLDNSNQLTNKIDNSLMIGFNSTTLPSVFVGPADASNKETRFGFVGIGTTTPKYELSVNGSMVAKNAVFVENLPGEWPDYVFKENYSLQSLSDVERFIESNHHLPGVPSQEEIKKDGLNLGEMEMIMMKKIEELTLYMIKMEKENEALRRQVEKLQTKD